MKVATDEVLLDAYVDAALKRSEARSARTANRHATAIWQIAGELRRRGPEARAKLLRLLEHPDAEVRGWAATHSLDFASEQAEFILRRLAQAPGIKGYDARMVLELWKEGKLGLP